MDRDTLYHKLNKSFNSEELRTICFFLEVDYDNLNGNEKSSKIRELILLCERSGSLKELLTKCQEQRPNEIWVILEDNHDEDYFKNHNREQRSGGLSQYALTYII